MEKARDGFPSEVNIPEPTTKVLQQTRIHNTRSIETIFIVVSEMYENYHQILPIIAEKLHQEKAQQEKLKAVKARLNFEEASRYSESETPSRRRNLKKRLGPRYARTRSGSPKPRRGHSKSPREKDSKRRTVFKRLEKGKQKATTKVLALKIQKLLLRDIATKESIREERKQCQKKKCIKDPVEIHNIKQRDGESTEEFVRRYKLECRDVKGALKCMKISGFMHGITNPELIKRLHDKIPKSMDEMMSVTTVFLRGERQIEEMLKGQKTLTFDQGIKAKPWKRPGKDSKKRGNLRERQTTGNINGEEDGTEGPMIIEAEMRGHCVHRMYVDGGSSSKILYEHCFSKFRSEIKNQLIPANTPLVRFSGEIIWPLGQISLLVKIGDEEHSTSAWMNFMMVRSPSPYNGNIGRPRVRKIQAIPCTAHGMLKSLVAGGIVTLRSSMIIPLECSMVLEPGVPRPVINQVTKENSRRYLDVFAWKPTDMTGVQRHISEHRLNVCEGCLPVRQKERGQAPERNKAISKEVKKLVEVDIIPQLAIKPSNEAEMAFKGMKQLITKLPMLTAPKEKEELIMYLAASTEAISAVLMTERDGKQVRICFVSRALQGSKINYTLMEKLILALTSSWSVQRTTHQIHQWRTGKNSRTHGYYSWTDHRCIDGSRAGLIIMNPKGMEFTYALRFRFNATNNEAEYEALIAGLWIAGQMGVHNLQANANYAQREIHEGSCSMHAGPRSVVAKSLRSGYYWPTMHADARNLIRECNDCQGIDIAGPFPEGPGKHANIRTAELDIVKNNEALGISLDLLEEKKEQAALQEARSSAKMERYYDARV
nr:reverse transcriptase domain-containing protein [Tanacetum cinerariifolium]